MFRYCKIFRNFFLNQVAVFMQTIDNMSVKQRIYAFIKYKSISVKKFEELCELSNGYISSMRKGFGTDKLNNVLNVFPELNREWLLYGEGEMLLKSEPEAGQKNVLAKKTNEVYLLPVSAQAGSLNDFVTSVKIDECEKITSPVKGIDFAMSVTGDSMAPEYPNGSQILVKKIDEKAFIEWGKVYVLDTCNGSVIKEIHKGDNENEVKCVSLNQNPKFSPFTVNMSDIYGMYKVVMCMSLK